MHHEADDSRPAGSKVVAGQSVRKIGIFMSQNKKQKKQLDVERKKLAQLQLKLAGAKQQLDDPDEVTRLEQEIAATNSRLEKLKHAE
ncbi:MAG TPA: hypothetical protein VGM05_22980 [Planctomycetaceae bacterium]